MLSNYRNPLPIVNIRSTGKSPGLIAGSGGAALGTSMHGVKARFKFVAVTRTSIIGLRIFAFVSNGSSEKCGDESMRAMYYGSHWIFCAAGTYFVHIRYDVFNPRRQTQRDCMMIARTQRRVQSQ